MPKPMISNATLHGSPKTWIGVLGFVVCVISGIDSRALAGSASGTASVIIQEEGSVGEVTPTPTTTPTTTTPIPATSTVNGGGATSPEAATTQAGVTTFRPVPSAGPVSTEAAFSPTTETSETATGSSGDGAGNAATGQQGPRLPRGAQPVGNLLGGVSAVAVTGTPNQHYGISLPGATVITQGAQTTVIEGFVHNAGATPTLGSGGRGSFNVGAKVAPGAEGGTGGAATGQGNPNFQGPVTISDPFIDVIIQYN
jgi:hypothetical protein